MPLTESQILSLEAGAGADEIVAPIAGWVKRDLHDWEAAFEGKYDYLRRVSFQNDFHKQTGWFKEHQGIWYENELPKFSRSLDAVEQLESTLERRGLAGEYGECLVKLLMQGSDAPWAVDTLPSWEWFKLIHASPLARVKAALLCAAKETK